MLKQKSNHFIVQFVKAPVKGFRLIREMQECTTVLFHRKKTKNNHKNVRKTCYWKPFLLFVVIASEHVGTQSTQGTLARQHGRHVGTWERKHERHVGAWAHKHARHVSTWARNHARHVGTLARKARNLADSFSRGLRV